MTSIVEVKLDVQYGCYLSEVPSLLKAAKAMDLNVIGVSFHIGSGFQEGHAFDETLRAADEVFTIASRVGFSMSLLDIGGGFKGNNKPKVPFAKIANGLNEALDRYFPPERKVKIIAEPGRYFVSSAATLALSIIGKKILQQNDNSTSHWRRMYFLNDGRHGSFTFVFNSTYPDKEPDVLKPTDRKELYRSSVWGPTLSPQDCIFEDCELPDLEVGEWVYFQNMGAYSMTMHRGEMKFGGVKCPKIYYVCCSEVWENLKFQRF